jgi:hypothetical protein
MPIITPLNTITLISKDVGTIGLFRPMTSPCCSTNVGIDQGEHISINGFYRFYTQFKKK